MPGAHLPLRTGSTRADHVTVSRDRGTPQRASFTATHATIASTSICYYARRVHITQSVKSIGRMSVCLSLPFLPVSFNYKGLEIAAHSDCSEFLRYTSILIFLLAQLPFIFPALSSSAIPLYSYYTSLFFFHFPFTARAFHPLSFTSSSLSPYLPLPSFAFSFRSLFHFLFSSLFLSQFTDLIHFLSNMILRLTPTHPLQILM